MFPMVQPANSTPFWGRGEQQHSNRVSQYVKYEHELDCSDITFPVTPTYHKSLNKIEQKNNISLTILNTDFIQEYVEFIIVHP